MKAQETTQVHNGFIIARLPKQLSAKESACNAGERFDPWLGRCPGEGNGNNSITLASNSKATKIVNQNDMNENITQDTILYKTLKFFLME